MVTYHYVLQFVRGAPKGTSPLVYEEQTFDTREELVARLGQIESTNLLHKYYCKANSIIYNPVYTSLKVLRRASCPLPDSRELLAGVESTYLEG